MHMFVLYSSFLFADDSVPFYSNILKLQINLTYNFKNFNFFFTFLSIFFEISILQKILDSNLWLLVGYKSQLLIMLMYYLYFLI